MLARRRRRGEGRGRFVLGLRWREGCEFGKAINGLLELTRQLAIAKDAVALAIERVLAAPSAKDHFGMAQEVAVDRDVHALDGKRCGLQPGGVGMGDPFLCDALPQTQDVGHNAGALLGKGGGR